MKIKISRFTQQILSFIKTKSLVSKDDKIWNDTPSIDLGSESASDNIEINKSKQERETEIDFHKLQIATLPNNWMMTKIGFGSHIDSKGILTFSPNNIVVNSNAFSQDSWVKENCRIFIDTPSSPVIGEKSWRLIENDSNSAHYIYGKSYNITNSHIIISLFAKPLERDAIVLEISNFINGSAGCRFNLTNGTVESAISTTNDYSDLKASISKLPGGWYRCALRVKKEHDTNENYLTISLASSETNLYQGDGQSGLLISCAQMEAVTYQDLPQEYLDSKTAPALGLRFNHDPKSIKQIGLVLENNAENQLSFGESFSEPNSELAGWIYTGIRRLSQNKPSPSGELVASHFVALTDNATLLYSKQSQNSIERTFSCWLRSPSGRDQIKYSSDGGMSWNLLEINQFWERYILILKPLKHQIGFLLPNASQEIEMWGAQLENGIYATSYIPSERGVSRRSEDSLLIIDSKLREVEMKIFDLATQKQEIYKSKVGREIEKKNIIISGWREIKA